MVNCEWAEVYRSSFIAYRFVILSTKINLTLGTCFTIINEILTTYCYGTIYNTYRKL